MVNIIIIIDSNVNRYTKNYFSVKRQLEFNLVLNKVYAYCTYKKKKTSFIKIMSFQHIKEMIDENFEFKNSTKIYYESKLNCKL